MNNPYAKYVAGHDALEVLKTTPVRVSEVGRKVLPYLANQPWAEGKWTIAQILLHLAQCEMMFGTRYRQALSTANYQIQPFDQDRWMERELGIDAATALGAFLGMRALNVALLGGLSEADRNRGFNHPELGAGTVGELMELTAGHDLNHLAQLESFASDLK